MKQMIPESVSIKDWTFINRIELPSKGIICVAPHTSNWDFIWGIRLKKTLHLNAKFLMKKEWFRFPFGYFMKKLGGIPVDRSKKTSMTDQMAHEFDKTDSLYIAITPEGTRKSNPEWKKGFYYIALKAKVPIILAFLDYQLKQIGFGKILIPTGNFEKDMIEIKEFYKNIHAKFPSKFAY